MASMTISTQSLKTEMNRLMYIPDRYPSCADDCNQAIKDIFRYIQPFQLTDNQKELVLTRILSVKKTTEIIKAQDQVINHLCIQLLQTSFGELVLTSHLDFNFNLFPSNEKKRLLSFYEDKIQLHRSPHGSTLIIKTPIKPMSDDESHLFWESLEVELAKHEKLDYINFQYGNTDYFSPLFKHFCREKPSLNRMEEKYKLIFQDKEILEENFPVLWLCGVWFHSLFQANLQEISTRLIDFTNAPVPVLNVGFSEILAKVKNEGSLYFSDEMEEEALDNYATLLPYFGFDPARFSNSKTENSNKETQ